MCITTRVAGIVSAIGLNNNGAHLHSKVRMLVITMANEIGKMIADNWKT